MQPVVVICAAFEVQQPCCTVHPVIADVEFSKLGLFNNWPLGTVTSTIDTPSNQNVRWLSFSNPNERYGWVVLAT